MRQNLLNDGTILEETSLKNVQNIISTWVDYTLTINETTKTNISKLKKNNFWNSLSYNFKETVIESLKFQDECINNFYKLIESIENDDISNKDITILNDIGYKASNYTHEYAFTYKENINLDHFDRENFLLAINIYTKNKEYFESLKYAEKDAKILKNYLQYSNLYF